METKFRRKGSGLCTSFSVPKFYTDFEVNTIFLFIKETVWCLDKMQLHIAHM